MARIHNLGFPRIGARRELKFALESFWAGKTPAADLDAVARDLRAGNWRRQAACDLVPIGDFSFYDQVLDASFLVGNVPGRVAATGGSDLDRYFRAARGRSAGDGDDAAVRAGEMTKWFDTNYHYIVPEFDGDTAFSLNAAKLFGEIDAALAQGVAVKPVIIGPVSYLWLGKAKDGTDRLALLDGLLAVYDELLRALAAKGIEWVQIDEPALVTDLDADWRGAFARAYGPLSETGVKILLAAYFGPLGDNLNLACGLPVAGLHVDAVRGELELDDVAGTLPGDKVLSVGIVDGRNVWKTDLAAALDRIEPLADARGERLWLAPSCSLLHVPVDLALETELDDEIAGWLAFAVQKLDELAILRDAVNAGRGAVADALRDNAAALAGRRASPRVHNPAVKAKAAAIAAGAGERQSPYAVRAAAQHRRLRLPLFPTTTIGSFPQTADIRSARRQFKAGALDRAGYEAGMKREIRHAVREQEVLGLDVLVHGEAERNDMVEYFGEQLQGFVFSKSAWVQSYGSRCVKPPILFGDISRPGPMTVDWITYAQSLTDRPMKGMLTGPVTMLNWSFVRDDQPRSETCRQLALAIRDEVLDLEAAGVAIVQIDEAALREGLPLRRAAWGEYLGWAVEAFRVAANGVRDETQIHTHMCYSEFNDIIEAIAGMDADVITIETSRSDMELLDVFETFDYPNDIGPGVYDIHSPNIPSIDQVVIAMNKAVRRIPAARLWINPDCGLKTRRWDEVVPALRNMVEAARRLRVAHGANAA